MTADYGRREPRIKFENRLALLSLTGGLAGAAVSMVFVWTGGYTPKVQWTLTVLILGCWLGFAIALRDRIVRPLQIASNMLSALKEGDFSVRARGGKKGDVLDEVYVSLNDLGETLHEQRLGALEATTLLRTVMFPPSLRAKRWLMVSPRPVPPCLRVGEASTWLNGLNSSAS